MTHVVTQNCIGCRDMSCATACPMECFHVGPKMLYIDPEECIDCELCVAECPVDAIFHEDDLAKELISDIQLNREMVKIHPVFDLK